MEAHRHAGQCHCGAVRFEVQLSDGFATIRRCTCSFCRMRGAIAVSAEIGGIRFIRGEDALTSYRFNTGSAQHFFCSRCGIYTHHQRRSNPAQYGVNVACLDGVSPFDFPDVPVLDGMQHPSDTGRLRWAGTLRFEPTPIDTTARGRRLHARKPADRTGSRRPCRPAPRRRAASTPARAAQARPAGRPDAI